MAKVMTDGSLDPVNYGTVPHTRQTKGQPFTMGGTGLDLDTTNAIPQGPNLEDQPKQNYDVKRTFASPLKAPLMTSAQEGSAGSPSSSKYGTGF